MLTLSVTNQDSTSPEYGTSTTLDLPDKSLVSYQYSLESDDLSAFTSAYTTSINLPPTHKNLVALNQPQIHGTGGVFTYVLSDDSQEIDHGQFVISSVTDTINVNLFSTVAALNTQLSAVTSFVHTSNGVKYVSDYFGTAHIADNSAATYHPESDSYPCWDNFYISSLGAQAPRNGLKSDTSSDSWSLFTVGIPNFGKSSEFEFENTKTGYVQAIFPSGAGQTPYATNLVDTIRECAEGIQLLQAPSLWRQDCFRLQVRWYQLRTVIDVRSLLYSLFANISSSVTISERLMNILEGTYVVGPRISDIARNIGTDDTPEWVFNLADVYGYFDKPWELIKKIIKKFNIRIIVSETGGLFSFALCSTKDYYRSSIVDLASYLDYSKYDVKPYAYTSKKIYFEDEPVGSKFQELYKNITGVDFSRYSIKSTYPVQSEKEWFKDKMKYGVSSTTNVSVKYRDGQNVYDKASRKSFNLSYHMLEAFDTDDNEIDVNGILCILSYSRGSSTDRDGSCLITRDLLTEGGNLFKGYYGMHGDKKMTFALCTNTTVVMTSDRRQWPTIGGWGYTYAGVPVIVTDSASGDMFLYGKPDAYNSKYPKYGSLVSSRFQDVLDATNSSTCTINVFLDKLRSASSLTVDQLTRSIYWFDNAYWCVYNIKSYIAGSNEPTEVVFLKINSLSNYINPETVDTVITASHCSLQYWDDSNDTWVTIPSGSSRTVTKHPGMNIAVRLSSPDSGYTWYRWEFTPQGGSTEYNYEYTTATIIANSDSTLVGVATRSYSVTASVTGSGTVNPGSQSVVEGGNASIFATPSDGYVVTSWSDTVGGVTTTYTTRAEEFTIENIQGDHTVVCNFGMATAVCSVRMIDISGTDRGTVSVTNMDTLEPIATPSVFTVPLDTNLSINLLYDNTLYSFIGWYEDSSRITPASDLLPITPTIFNTVASSLSFNRYAVLQRTGSRTHAINTTANPAAGYYWSSHTIDIEEEGSVQLTYNARASYTFGSIEVYNSLNQWVTLTNNPYTDPDGTVFTRSSNRVDVSNVMGDHTVRINSTYVPPSTYKCTVNCAVPGATVTYRINSGSNQTITSFPYEITGLYEDNSVYLTYSHSPYSDFSSWTGYITRTGESISFAMPPQDVTMNANASTYTVTLADSPSGSVSEFSIEGTYESKTATSVTAYAGSVVDLDYTASSGYSADGWTDISGTSSSRSYTITSSTTLTARCQSGSQPIVSASLPQGLYDAGARLSWSTNSSVWIDISSRSFSMGFPSGSTVYLKCTHADDDLNSYISAENFAWGDGTMGDMVYKANITSDWAVGECTADQFTIDTAVSPSAAQSAGASTSVTKGGQVVPSLALNYAGTTLVLHATDGTGWHFDYWDDISYDAERTIRLPAANSTYNALYANYYLLSQPTVSNSVQALIRTYIGTTEVTSFPARIHTNETVTVDVTLIAGGYDIVSWTVNDTTYDDTTSSFEYTVESEDITIFRANVLGIKNVAAEVHGAPSGTTLNSFYYIDGGQTVYPSSYTQSVPAHIPTSATSIVTVLNTVSGYTCVSCPVTNGLDEDDPDRIVYYTIPVVNNTATLLNGNFPASDFFVIEARYTSVSVPKTITFSSVETSLETTPALSYKIGSGSETTYTQPFNANVGDSVTLYYTRSTYADAYQWYSGSTHLDNDNQQSYTFTVSDDTSISVSTKSVRISYSEYPSYTNAVYFSVSGSRVTYTDSFAGNHVTVTASSGVQHFTQWQDGSTNPRTIAVPTSNTTYYALYTDSYTVSAVTTTEGTSPFTSLSMTIGGEEADPSVPHSDIVSGTEVVVTWTLDSHYVSTGWQGSSVLPVSPATFTVEGPLNLTLIVEEYLHLYGDINPSGAGTIDDVSYASTSSGPWTSVGVPTATTYVSVPNGYYVKLTCSAASGYTFDRWYCGSTELPNSQVVQEYIWDTTTTTAPSLTSTIIAKFTGGSSWTGLTFRPDGASATVYLEVTTSGSATAPECQYSVDRGTTWTNMPTSSDTKVTFTDDMWVRGLNLTGWYNGTSNSYGHTFRFSSNVTILGNLMSLIDQTGSTLSIPNDRCFCRIFYQGTTITNASGIVLPATTLMQSCYAYMFYGCSRLTSGPSSLPATTVTATCYQYMFRGCSVLTNAPVLRATNLASKCYFHMFDSCAALTGPVYIYTSTATTSTYTQYMFASSGTATGAGGTIYVAGNSQTWTSTTAGVNTTYWTVTNM